MLGPLDPSLLKGQICEEYKRRSLTTTDSRIWRALELLREARTIQVGYIASSVNLSESRFRHLFKQELGISPTHYFKLVRLDQATELLKHTFLTIKEVAIRVGFNDISHFVRDYKAIYGQTPSEARSFLRGKPIAKFHHSRVG